MYSVRPRTLQFHWLTQINSHMLIIVSTFNMAVSTCDAFEAEEVGSPSQHALQLINIQSRDFLQCLLEKLWKFISFFRQECLVFLKVSFYGCFKYESNLTTFALFGILMVVFMLIVICTDLFSGSLHKGKKWLSKPPGDNRVF